MLIESFLKYIQYERGLSSHTLIAYENDLRQFTEYLQGSCSICDPTRADQQAVRGWIVLLMGGNASERTVRRKISALHAYYKYCMRQGEIEQDPVRGLSLPRIRKKLPQYVRDSEMDLLLDQTFPVSDFRNLRDRLLLLLFYETGIRRAELIGLLDRDVSLEEQTLKVLGKRNRERIIPIGRELSETIAYYRANREQQLGFVPHFFFVRENGEPLYAKQVYRIVHKALDAVTTLQKRSPHVLRHTFATSMLNGGASLNSVKELLGHRSLASTQIYTHVSLEELKISYKQAHPRAELLK